MKPVRLWMAGMSVLLGAAACGEDSSDPASDASGGATSTTGGAATSGAAGDEGSGGSSQGGAGQGGSSQGGPIEAENAAAYFEQLAQLVCGGLATCCSEAGFAFSEEPCVALLSSAGAQLQGLTYDREAGEACLNDLRERADDCGPGGELICEGVFLGSVELGGECTQNADCVPSELGEVRCEMVGTSLAQRCVVSIHAGEGETCAENCFEGTGLTSCTYLLPSAGEGEPERRQCWLNDGLFCDPSALVCVPVRQDGESCENSAECGPYATCDGVCGQAAAEGDPCAAFSECTQGFTCHPDEDVCQPGLAVTLEGACSTFSGQ